MHHACHKVFLTDFSYTKAHAHGQVLSIGVVFKFIAATCMARELCVNKKNQKNKKIKVSNLVA